MIAWKLKLWRAAGAAAALSLAACGGEAGEAGEGGEAGETGEAAIGGEAGEAGGEAGEAAIGESGGEHGEAGVASAYAGLSGDQRTALRIQHLRGFVIAAEGVIGRGGDTDVVDAAVLVQQGLLEVYDPAANQFGALDIAPVRAAGDGMELSRAEMQQRLQAANAALDAGLAELNGVDYAQLTVRMIDIATGIYQHVVRPGFVDPIEYQHSHGAAQAAQQTLRFGETALRDADADAFSEAQSELDRFIGLWPSADAPENPARYQQVLAQSSRVRLALSPYL